MRAKLPPAKNPQIYTVLFECFLCVLIAYNTYFALTKKGFSPTDSYEKTGKYFTEEQENELMQFSKSPAVHMSHQPFLDTWSTIRMMIGTTLVNVLTWLVLVISLSQTTKKDILIFYRGPSAVLLIVSAFRVHIEMQNIDKLVSSERYKDFTYNRMIPIVHFIDHTENVDAPDTIILDDGSELVRQDLLDVELPNIETHSKGTMYVGYASKGQELMHHPYTSNVVILNLILGTVLLVEGVMGRFFPFFGDGKNFLR